MNKFCNIIRLQNIFILILDIFFICTNSELKTYKKENF